MNKIIILGTLTRDLELKYTDNGSCIGNFGIATNEKWKNQQGQLQEKAHFFDVSVFGKQAETISKHFHKGSRILIEGALDYQSWQTQTGEKRSKVGIKLQSFTFVDRKSDTQTQPPQPNQPPQQGQNNQPTQTTNQNQGNNLNQTPTQNQQAAMPEIDIDEGEIPFLYIPKNLAMVV